MSRQAGSFADFFPAAPSVIQQKQKKAALDRQQRKSRSSEPTRADDALTNGSTFSPHSSVPQSLMQYAATFPQNPSDQDDRDPLNGELGDMLNGVGSASSLNSVGSSIFSNPVHNENGQHRGTGLGSLTLTPLTTHESSPPEKMSSPDKCLVNSIKPHLNGGGFRNSNESVTATAIEQPGIAAVPSNNPIQARPGPGQAKGQRASYDPELDFHTTSKERRKGKPKYKKFGEEEHGLTPDPRLAIPGYTSGNLVVRLSGEAKGWKLRQRRAPYLLAPYTWDTSISMGAGPPTAVVVVGFDPFTPESQIRAVFASYGEIAELENKTDPDTGIFLGVCTIKYRDSRLLRGPPMLAADATKAAERQGNGHRVGMNTVRVEKDPRGNKCKRYMDALIKRNRDRRVQERLAVEVSRPRPIDSQEQSLAPPPNAPKGPSGMGLSIKPPAGPRVAEAPKPLPLMSHLIEKEPVLSKIRRKPYVFISCEHVPVLGSTIPHLKKRLRSYRIEDIRLDETGYYIVFADSGAGEAEAVRCFEGANMQPLFTYTMSMECQQYGNPTYERSPTPERALAEQHEREIEEQRQKDDEADFEAEMKQRAHDLDPVKAVLEQLRIELLDKVMTDIRTRIAAPALYEYLDPVRQAAKRRKLGVSDPTEQQRPANLIPLGDETPSNRTPMTRSGPSGAFRKQIPAADLSRIRKEQGQATFNPFMDERRQRPPKRKLETQQLHRRLYDFYSEEGSEDEQATLDQDSRSMSRMSSVAPTAEKDEETASSPHKRQRVLREPTPEDSGDETLGIAKSVLDPHLLKKDCEDMAPRELQLVLDTVPKHSKLYKKAKRESLIRQKTQADDRLFQMKSEEREELVENVDIVTDVAMSGVVSAELVDVTKLKKKPKKTKKSKKQIFEEREAAKALTLSARDLVQSAVEDETTPEIAPEDPVDLDRIEEQEEEPRAEVEWGVSTDVPRRTVEDDLEMILDVDGWQNLVKDDEDLALLKQALQDHGCATFADTNLWAYQQKQIKTMNNGGVYGITQEDCFIRGYYVPNTTGSARTEGFKKILEAEKSKYLPHRIKVAEARAKREAEARNPIAIAAAEAAEAAEAARQAKLASNATSRSARANNRTHLKDISVTKQNLTADGQQSDAIRFNQLKKRKKPVRFDRSAIHGWGLYAEENIAISDMIIEYVGEKVRQAVANVRELRYDKQGMGSSYLFRIDEDAVVDATKKGGIARFINHSCSPNCTAKIIRVDGTKRIVIYALKEIAKNDELTYDYKFDREMDNDDRIPCLCGSEVCKGFLN